MIKFWKIIILGALLQPIETLAQTPDSAIRNNTREDSIFAKSDSLPRVSDLALQFLADEVAFNITSFSLWGNELYKPSSDNSLGVFGLLASTITVPAAIYFTSELLGLRKGSFEYSVAGAALGLLVTSPALLLTGIIPKTYLGLYCGFSLPLVVFAQLIYNLTMK